MGEHHFYSAEWFLLVLLLPLLVFLDWKYIRRKSPVLVVSVVSNIKNTTMETLLSPTVVMLTLRIVTLFLIILALADLRQVRMVRNDMPVAEADIVMALDVSRSMLIEDIKPNRLTALKSVLSQFVAARSTDRFGIVLYAGESMVLCPLTKNYPYLLTQINQMDSKALADGTAIGVGLASAVNVLKQSKSPNKVIILLTDGENNTGYISPMTASEIARKFKIKIYTIGIGTTGKAPYPILDLNGKKTYQYIETAIDEDILSMMAVNTGGNYFRAKDATGLQTIYKEIDKLQKTKKLHIDITYDAEYQYFLFAALFVFLTEMFLKVTVYRPWLV